MNIQHPPARHVASKNYYKIVSHATRFEFNKPHGTLDRSYNMDIPNH